MWFSKDDLEIHVTMIKKVKGLDSRTVVWVAINRAPHTNVIPCIIE